MSFCLSLPPETAVQGKTSLIGHTLADLQALVQTMDEPAFRADQLHQWLYVRCARSWDEMTNLKKTFRARLAETFQIGQLDIATRQVSRDGTIKYLFRLADGNVVESVLMYFEERGTYALCISTQVGCAVNCSFCATAKLGFIRQLTAGEIAEQYLFTQADSGQEIRNIVFMGQGEPLLNYDALIQAVQLLNQSAEVGMRHITVSTSGIVPRIYDLAAENLQLTLAVSLHAPNDTLRESIMPINKRWPLADLMAALRHYVCHTGKRLTIEYILLADCNDQPEHAHELNRLLEGLKCNVNLIPYNPVAACDQFKRPSNNAIHRFRNIIGTSGKKVTIRVERGADIDAACGQLANKQ